MRKIQVVIPMSGAGQRFLDAGYKDIKPIIDIAGKPLMTRLLEKFPKEWRFVFICREDHLRETPLEKILLESCPNAEIVSIAPHKRGPVHAILEAGHAVKDDMPTLVNHCDFSFVWDPEHFAEFTERTDADAAILCYRGFQPHYWTGTMYAYCKVEGGRVLDIKEKECFTDDRTQEYASSGSYYFKTGALLKDSCEKTIARDLNLNGEYYVSLANKPLIDSGGDVRVYEIPYFLQWGTPQDVEDYLYWHRLFDKFAEFKPGPDEDGPRLAMPMAGLGSRFKDGGVPKPLIPVLGLPMFETARGYLPASSKAPVLVLRDEIEKEVRSVNSDAEFVVLDAPTDGQAVTTERALEKLDLKEPVLVSACDHGLLWDREKWAVAIGEDPDLIVVGQRGYPGARRKPKSFAYIVADDSAKITSVSVKVPVSETPQRDVVLVGTFYFKSASLMAELIQELKEKDVRVNGELYLDSVVNLAVERGLNCRLFEADGYMNWGAPDALQEFSHWHGYFMAAKT